MRYTHDYNIVYRVKGQIQHHGEPRETVPFTRFCNSNAGTGFNSGGRCAGNATLGNCQSQFIVSDLGLSNKEKREIVEAVNKIVDNAIRAVEGENR
jgi:hypothetical protein